MAKQIAFLGVGNMGGPMSANLVKAGFEVRAYDPSSKACERAAKNGITCFDSPAEAASKAQVVCSAVPTVDDAIEAYLGERGAFKTAAKGTVCFDFSTISVEGSQKIAAEAKKKGIRFLDTPVSGSVPHATAGTLSIIAGGDASALKEHDDVLKAIGQHVNHFGPNGSGLRMKFVTNQIFASVMSGLAEGLTVGKKSGLDPNAMVAFLKTSAIPKIVDYKGGPMAVKDYNPTFTVNLMLKDLRLITANAEALKVPIPTASIARQAYMGAAALGYGDKDQCAILEYFEKGAGI
jgi:3-hydroxyisobutyrate dehydrogenase-like beta-hydroxyacid dehydrogenase